MPTSPISADGRETGRSCHRRQARRAHGKPRPTLVVQADVFAETHGSITICPVTSDVIDAPLFRVSVHPGTRTGLESSSQVMVDKIVSVPRSAVGKSIGRCDTAELQLVDDALRRWLAQ